MKKTVTINLGGSIFTADEDAFARLQDYLNALERKFKQTESKEEILDDIESRFAELLLAEINTNTRVVTLAHVEKVIGIMGRPEDFEDENSESYSGQQSEKQSYNYINTGKKLYRDGDNRVIGGVCAGLGHYFGIDAVWIRLAWLLAVFSLGFGVLLYFILYLIMPKARTTAEKLEMQGKAVNIDNIGKKVDAEFHRIRKSIENIDEKKVEQRFRKAGNQFFGAIAQIAHFFIRFMSKIIGVGMIVISGFILFFLGIAFIALIAGAGTFNTNINGVNTSISVWEWFPLIFEHAYSPYLIIVGAALIVMIPFVSIMAGGISFVSSFKGIPRGFGMILFGKWILGVILFAIGIAGTANDFSQNAVYTENQVIENTSDTLFIALNISELNDELLQNQWPFWQDEENGMVLLNNVRLNIEYNTTGDAFELQKKFKAHASNTNNAHSRAKRIYLQSNHFENTLHIPAYLSFLKEDMWRNQQVELMLRIPNNKTIHIDYQLYTMLQPFKNFSGDELVDRFWIMKDGDLVQLD